MGELENCPNKQDIQLLEDYEDLMSEDEEKSDHDQDDNESASNSGSSAKSRKEIKHQQKLMKKLKKQEQDKIDQKYRNYYLSGHFFSRPTATTLYVLAQQLSHENNDFLWYAILGLTEAYLHQKLNQKYYDILFNELSNEVIRLNIQGEQREANPEEI